MRSVLFALTLFLAGCGGAPADDSGRHDSGLATNDTGDCDCNAQECGTNACGDSCGTCGDGVCVQGTCENECPSGTYECDGDCSDLLTDVHHCGSCDNDCGTASFGEITCQEATCVIECQTDALYCGGDDCSPCPEHADGVYCGGGECKASACEDGFIECDGQCLAPPAGTEASCENGQLVAYDCENTLTLNTGKVCECVDSVAEGGVYMLAREQVANPGINCGGWQNGVYEVAALELCGKGTWAIDVDSYLGWIDGIGRESAGAECGAPPQQGSAIDRCDTNIDLHDPVASYAEELYYDDECLYLQIGFEGNASAAATRVEVMGPLQPTDNRVLRSTFGASAGYTFQLPAGIAAEQILFRRSSGSTYYQDGFRVYQTLPNGEEVERNLTFHVGSAVTATYSFGGLIMPSSTWRYVPDMVESTLISIETQGTFELQTR